MMLPAADDLTLNSFDEFFENELYELKHGDGSREAFVLDEQPSTEAYYDNVEAATQIPKHTENTQAWRNGVWSLTQEPSIVVQKTRKGPPNQPFIAPKDLQRINCDPNIDFHFDTNHRNATENGDSVDMYHHFVQPEFQFDRQKTLSPSPMYPYISADDNNAFFDSWQQHFQDFHLHNATEVKPRTTNVQDSPVHAGSQQASTRYHYPFQNATATNLIPQDHQTNDTDYLFAWNMTTSRSSDGSQQSTNSYGSRLSNTNPNNPCSYPKLRSCKSTGNFSNEDFSHIVAPLPQRKAYKVIDDQYDPFQSGLGIHYPMPEEIGCAVSYTQVEVPDYQTLPMSQPQGDNPFITYPALPPAPIDTSAGGRRTRDRRHKSYSCSPSPPLSPAYLYISPRRASQHKSPSRPDHNRRKSIHKIGPIKDTSTSTNASMSPSHGRSRHRSPSRSRSLHLRTRSASSKPVRSSKTTSTPTSVTPTPTTATFDFDFVNYTAQDGAKLMSDVAPSGSSKTRARREQEARDKRKKLNEAAIVAVRRAGGDVRDLQHRLAL